MPKQRSNKRGLLGVLLAVCVLPSTAALHAQSPPELDKTVDDLGKPSGEIDGGRSTGGELPFVPLSGYSMFRRGVRLYNPLSLDDIAAAHETAYERMRRALEAKTKNRNATVRVRALYDLADLHSAVGNMEDCIARLEEILELIEGAQVPAPTRRFFIAAAGVAHMRLGEVNNCIKYHNEQSCIVPLSPRAQHREPEGFRQAKKYFAEFLETKPDHLQIRWLYNVVAMGLGEYPDKVPPAYLIPLPRSDPSLNIGKFVDTAAALGISAWDAAGGSIMDDFDGDGLLDIVSTSWDATANMHFFRNNGDGTFTDRTEEAGVVGQRGGLNAVQGDYDNDGDLDILILRGAWQDSQRNTLLANDGSGRFTDVTEQAGILEPVGPGQVGAWADYDNDGDLDLFIGYETRKAEINRPHHNLLYRNNGDGTFTEVGEQAGLRFFSYTKGASWGDFDNDGFIDLYVSNLSQPNRLFRNQGDGTFEDVTKKAGVAEPGPSFACWFFDFDNDDRLDIFVACYEDPNDTYRSYLGLPRVGALHKLYHNKGDGTFEDVAEKMGMTTVCMTMGANFGDLNEDGWLDVYLGTGAPPYGDVVPHTAFLNLGGKKFEDVTVVTGLGHLQKGHGIAFGDIDNDGDLDIYAQLGGAVPGDAFGNALFQNPGHGNNWITIRLRGTKTNHFGVGVRIKMTVVDDKGERSLRCRQVNWGGSFGSSSLQQEIGLGPGGKIESLEIRWPASGTTQTFKNVQANRIIEITEGVDEIKAINLPRIKLPSGRHEHHHMASQPVEKG